MYLVSPVQRNHADTTHLPRGPWTIHAKWAEPGDSCGPVAMVRASCRGEYVTMFAHFFRPEPGTDSIVQVQNHGPDGEPYDGTHAEYSD